MSQQFVFPRIVRRPLSPAQLLSQLFAQFNQSFLHLTAGARSIHRHFRSANQPFFRLSPRGLRISRFRLNVASLLSPTSIRGYSRSRLGVKFSGLVALLTTVFSSATTTKRRGPVVLHAVAPGSNPVNSNLRLGFISGCPGFNCTIFCK